MFSKRKVVVLESGRWSADQVTVRPFFENLSCLTFLWDEEEIEKRWKAVLDKNPKATPGPTLQLGGRHFVKDGQIMVLDVFPSNYKKSQLYGWLAVAMIPVTSDGYIALQAPVSSIAASIGGGIRVPGCTLPHCDIFGHTAKEMKEEFGVQVERKDLSVLGLIEVQKPKLHHGLIVEVKLAQTSQELEEAWNTAEDKWEGELKFLKFQGRAGVLEGELFENYAMYNPQGLLIISMFVDIREGSYLTKHLSLKTGWW